MSTQNNVGSGQGGLGAAQDALTVAVANFGDVAVQLTGTFVGTVTFEATVDNVTWVALSLTPSAGGSAVTTATAPGIWQGTCGGYYAVRARCSAFTSGTIYVAINASSRLLSNQVTVEVAADGALSGDGSLGDPLAVIPDGVTVDVNGSNQLEVIADIPAIDATFLTATDETGTLTGSRQLVDGTNTTIDVTTPGQIKVNASGGSFDPAADETITGSWVFAPDTAGGKDPVTFTPQLSAELIVDGNWTLGMGWAESPVGTFTHTAGQSASLANSVATVVGTYYVVSAHQVSGTSGAITIRVGGVNTLSFSGGDGDTTQTQIVQAIDTSGLVIAITDDTYDGVLTAISVKAAPAYLVSIDPLTGHSLASVYLKDAASWYMENDGSFTFKTPSISFGLFSDDGAGMFMRAPANGLSVDYRAGGGNDVALQLNTDAGSAFFTMSGGSDVFTLNHDLVGQNFQGTFTASDTTPGASNAGVVGATSTLVFKDGLFVGTV